MKLDKKYPILSLNQIIKNRIISFKEITKTPKLLGHFKDYLKIGYYPIFKNYQRKISVYEALAGVIEKSVYMDIAAYYRLKTSTLPIFKKIIYFIHTLKPSSIQGDFRCKDVILEVGGSGKDLSQIKGLNNAYLVCDDILTGNNKKIRFIYWVFCIRHFRNLSLAIWIGFVFEPPAFPSEPPNALHQNPQTPATGAYLQLSGDDELKLYFPI
ncbi:MAG: hypothetical protein GF335_01610 [Candidatus Moranbacteria bacterium]|nr:hypothetical protein [Candidatus Moranbacteria bacterium]